MQKSIISNSALLVLSGDETLFIDYSNGGPMWQGEGHREIRKRIEFTSHFTQAPVVNVGFSLLDFAQDRAVRAEVVAEKVGAVSFDLVFKIWGDTRAAQGRANWIALGTAGKSDDFWQLQEEGIT